MQGFTHMVGGTTAAILYLAITNDGNPTPVELELVALGSGAIAG